MKQISVEKSGFEKEFDWVVDFWWWIVISEALRFWGT